jgi:hypothetical protein
MATDKFPKLCTLISENFVQLCSSYTNFEVLDGKKKHLSTHLLHIHRLYQFIPTEQSTLYFTQLVLQRQLGLLNGFTLDRCQQQQPFYIFDLALSSFYVRCIFLILNDVCLLPE